MIAQSQTHQPPETKKHPSHCPRLHCQIHLNMDFCPAQLSQPADIPRMFPKNNILPKAPKKITKQTHLKMLVSIHKIRTYGRNHPERNTRKQTHFQPKFPRFGSPLRSPTPRRCRPDNPSIMQNIFALKIFSKANLFPTPRVYSGDRNGAVPNIGGTAMNTKIITLLACGCLLTTTGSALAGDFHFDLGLSTGHHGTSVGVSINAGHHQTIIVRRPVIRTLVEHVWVPTTQTVYRDVPVLDARGQTIAYKREATVIHGGYYQEVHKKILVHPGGRHKVIKTWTTRCDCPAGATRTRLLRQRVTDEPFNGHSCYAKTSGHKTKLHRAIQTRTAQRVEKHRTIRNERKVRPVRLIRRSR